MVHRYVEELPGESPNDRNDRAIRVAAQWYRNEALRVGGEAAAACVVLVSDDKLNREAAEQEGIRCCTATEYVTDILCMPELADVLSHGQIEDGGATVAHTHHAQRGNELFEPYLTPAEVRSQLRAGAVHKGTFFASREDRTEGFVTVHGRTDRILVQGIDMNRAIDRDVVVIRLLPKSQWVRTMR